MDFKKQWYIIEELIQNKEFNKAQEIIKEFMEQSEIKNVEDEQFTYFCFNDYIEEILYRDKYKSNKINKCPEINIAYLYCKLGYINVENKDYEEALKNLNEALKWNPMYLAVLFERAEVYKLRGELERYKAEIEKIYPYIFFNSFMARYYRALGFYYIEKEVYDVANALYSWSLDFVDTKEKERITIQELMYIAMKENRVACKSPIESIKKIFEDYNIPEGFDPRTVEIIINEYKEIQQRDDMKEETEYLSRVLFEITKDPQFAIRYTIKDEETGISIQVPEDWGVLRKSEFSKLNLAENTLFIFQTQNNEKISIFIESEDCGIGQFSKLYGTSIENMKEKGIVVLKENFKIFEDGFKLRQAIIETQNDNKKVRMIKNYVKVNNCLVNISWEISQDIQPKELLESLNNSLKMQMVLSIQGDKDKNNTDKIVREVRNKNYEMNIWNISLEELERAKIQLKEKENEIKTQVNDAKVSFINPAYMEKVCLATEIIKQIDKMIEWKKYLQDINEVVVTMGKDTCRIKSTKIKCTSSDGTLLETQDISSKEFEEFIENALCFMYDWNKNYTGKEIVPDENWSIIIKAENHEMKRFSGNSKYPYTWREFYKNFIYFIERTDLTFFEELFIKSLIYLVIAIEEEENHTIAKCLEWCKSHQLGEMIKQLPINHPARVLFKTLESITYSQCFKLVHETINILSTFIQDYPEENNNILNTLTSEQDISNVASEIVKYFKEKEENNK